MNEPKKKSKKVIIIINIIAIVIILSVVGFFVYDKYFRKEDKRGFGFREVDIEDICANWQKGQPDINGRPENFRPPENININRNRNRNMPTDFDPEKMAERQDLIQEICADGQVTEEEKKKFTELENE